MSAEITNTNQDLSNSLKRLNENMKNKYYFRLNPFKIINDANIREDYSKKNRRSSYYADCIFDNCNFFESGFASSIFINCEFVDCIFDFSNFQSCDFRKCKIRSTKAINEIKGNTFMKSVFYKCEFENLLLNSTNFCNSVFNNGSIVNCKLNSCALEDMVIKNSLLKSIRFSSQNFDFLRIENIQTKDVIFSFPSMPCIIGGLKYLKNTEDNVCFSSMGDNKRISREKYLSYIPDFINYYKAVKDYFILANIYLSLDYEIQSVFRFIVLGIEQSVRIHNFRKVKKYCYLLMNKNFNIQHKKIAYQIISDEISKIDFSESDKDCYNIHLREIRNILINETDRPYLNVNVATNIQENESDKISLFIDVLEKLIATTTDDIEEHSIELRHNSDLSFFIQIISNVSSLVVFLAAFFECISFAKDFTEFLIKKLKKNHNKDKAYDHTKATTLANIDINGLSSDQIKLIESLSDKSNVTIININNTLIDNHIEIKGVSHSMVNVGNIDNKIQNSYFPKNND